MSLNLTKPLAIFDLETTGVDPARDRIVEIAIIKLLTSGEKIEYLKRINPEMPIPKSASEIHGIYDEDIKNAPVFKDVVSEIVSILEGCDLAGYNSNRFDLPLLYEEILRAGGDIKIEGRRLIDVQRIFHKMEKRDLTAAYQFYCNKDMEDAHSALGDVKATLEVFESQLTRYSDDLKNDMNFLHEFTQDGRKVDFAGRMIYDENNNEIFNFGKHKGKSVAEVLENEPQYYDWIMKSDFPIDTKRRLTAIRLRKLGAKS